MAANQQQQQTETLCSTSSEDVDTVLIEAFYGGSHKLLVDTILEKLLKPNNIKTSFITLPDKKWHWRLMAGSLYCAEKIPIQTTPIRVLFCSSIVNLAEIVGLRPDLQSTIKIYYFHENQLAYPIRHQNTAGSDFQIGWTQIISCLAADKVLFNSNFNLESFLSRVDSFLRKVPCPEQRSGGNGICEKIRSKSSVLYFPIPSIQPRPFVAVSSLPSSLQTSPSSTEEERPLVILWNHRWEYDKNPELFFNTLYQLNECDKSYPFSLIVLGENYQESPEIFTSAHDKLLEHIHHWGYASTREDYISLLYEADVVVSTSNHEFYGISMLEATRAGCYPLCPKKLVYPEFYPPEHLYNTPTQLLKRLKNMCRYPHIVRRWQQEIKNGQEGKGNLTEPFTWESLASQYAQLFGIQNSHWS